MKKLIIIILVVLPALIKAQGVFTLSGKVGNDGPPAKVYLLYRDVKRIVIDSTDVVGGKFKFTGTLQEPTAARLILDHKGVGYAKTTMSADMTMLFIYEGEIKIKAPDSLKRAVFPGSPINIEYRKYQESLEAVNQEREQLHSSYRNATEEQRADSIYTSEYYEANEQLDRRYRELQLAHVKANPDSYVSLSLLKEAAVPFINVAVIAPLFDSLSERIRLSELGREFKAEIERRRALSIGQLAPDFIQNDQFDRPVSLSAFKGKYVLIDFWASWCKPCRAENPQLVTAYNEFKDKDFTIISVSLDRPGKKEDWLKAIETDKLEWTQVSDLKFWDNAVAKLYGIKSVPQNFLLDKNGKVIAQNLRGEELSKKLAEIL